MRPRLDTPRLDSPRLDSPQEAAVTWSGAGGRTRPAAADELLAAVLGDYRRWQRTCAEAAGPAAGPAPGEVPEEVPGAAVELLRGLSRRLAAESTPWPSPLYLGQLTPDPPLAAALAQFCALLYNPNNVTAEASPVTTELEHEVGDDLCRLVGHDPATGWAHLASGGHSANFEAVWIARTLRWLPAAAATLPQARELVAGLPPAALANPPVGRALGLVSELARRGLLAEARRRAAELRAERGSGRLLLARNAHYSWDKCADLLGFAPAEVERIGTDREHRLDLAELGRRVRESLERGRPLAAVVATLGSCGEGSVDDLDGLRRLRADCEQRYGASFHLHVDAAAGGYFRALCLRPDGSPRPYQELAEVLKPEVYRSLLALPEADSVTVDPHKSGRIPYPAGGLVLRDRRAAAVVGSGTGYFAEEPGGRLPYGSYTLEGARPGAAVAAVWAAHRLLGLHADGYGRLLGGWLAATRRLHERIAATPGLTGCFDPDLNVLNLSAEGARSEGARSDDLWSGGGGGNERWLARLRADAAAAPLTSLWVSGNSLEFPAGTGAARPVLRLCVLKELPGALPELVCRRLLDALRRSG